MRKYHLAFAIILGLSISGCGVYDYVFTKKAKDRLPGERLSILSLDKRLEPDPELTQLEIRLPRPIANPDWPEAGGYPNHVMQHLALGDDVKERWRSSAGAGQNLLAQPVATENRVFTMDGSASVRAFDSKSGSRIWEVDVTPEDASKAVGGGLAVVDGRVFVATGYAEVVALDAATGKELWRQSIIGPARSPPTVADGRVFVVTVDNQLEVLAAADGRKLWSHTGTPETAGLVGGGSPAVDGDVVVVAYSSGEIFALRVENGRQLWTDTLAATRRTDALSALADIRGRPIIDRGRVFAISHSGTMVSIDLRTGQRTWEQELGGTETPWVAGDFIYVISNRGELICLTRLDGRIRWVQELPRYEDAVNKKGPMIWSGPVLGGDRLIVVASNGEAMSFSPYTGAPLGRVVFPDGTFLTPILADGTLYVLTDEAELIAIR